MSPFRAQPGYALGVRRAIRVINTVPASVLRAAATMVTVIPAHPEHGPWRVRSSYRDAGVTGDAGRATP